MTYHRYDPKTCGTNRRGSTLAVAMLASFATGLAFSWLGAALLPTSGDALVSRAALVEGVGSDTWRRARMAVSHDAFLQPGTRGAR